VIDVMRPFCSGSRESPSCRLPDQGAGRAAAAVRPRNQPFGARRGDGPSRLPAVHPVRLARRRTPLAGRASAVYSPTIASRNAHTPEPIMTKSFATRFAPIALAALLSTAMLLATNALAGHQYRVAVAAQESAQVVAMDVQRVVIVGHRSAHA
jgi:hypothetical protein